MSKPIVSIYSVQEGKKVPFEFSIENGEILATYKDEFLKFPGGLTKDELLTQIAAHNDANEGVVAVSDGELQAQVELVEANERLLKDLL